MVSPILANIYLHYGLDLVDKRVKSHCQGQAHVIRFADDFVCAFQYTEIAVSARYRRSDWPNLQLPWKRPASTASAAQLQRRFTFLGFEVGLELITPRVWRRTAREELPSRSKRVYGMAESATGTCPCPCCNGDPQAAAERAYTIRALLRSFHHRVVKLLHKWLNRRSQRRSLAWSSLTALLNRARFPTEGCHARP